MTIKLGVLTIDGTHSVSEPVEADDEHLAEMHKVIEDVKNLKSLRIDMPGGRTRYFAPKHVVFIDVITVL